MQQRYHILIHKTKAIQQKKEVPLKSLSEKLRNKK